MMQRMEESDFFEGDGLIENLPLPTSNKLAQAANNSSSAIDESVQVLDIDFDSAYNVFKKQTESGNWNRIFEEIEDGSKPSKSALLKRYRALRDEMMFLETQIGGVPEDISEPERLPTSTDFTRFLNKTESSNEMEIVSKSINEEKSNIELLDARIAKIERCVLGAHSLDGSMAWLTEDVQDDKTLIGVAEKMKGMVQCLDYANSVNSEAVQSFLSTIAKTEDKTQIIEELQNEKIRTLNEMLRKVNSTADLVPLLIERLTTLKSVHQRASSFSDLLSSIESDQVQLKALLNSVDEHIDQVQNNLNNNLEEFQKKMSEMTAVILGKNK